MQKGITENIFEKVLFGCRIFVLIAVVSLLVASFLMFFKGSFSIVQGSVAFFHEIGTSGFNLHSDNTMVMKFISGVDYFLFAIVLMIFSMGIYELFVSKIDPLSRKEETRPNWLRINSLGDLKNYLSKVILIILIVGFFEQSFHLSYKTPLDLLCLGGGILLVSLSLFFSHRIKS